MELIEEINELAKGMPVVRIMEVCGSHTNTIMRYGLREMLPKNIELISGPGCPVCVTSQKDIDSVIEMALQGVKIACHGDILRVPGTKMSLEDARSQGAKVKEVYSPLEVKHDAVFFGIGFETTSPMTAYLLKKGIKVYSSHKLMIPAMQTLINGEMKIDGFIDPGHVSAIIGSNTWEQIEAAQVISGFAPEMVLRAITLLLEQIKHKTKKVINDYKEVVKPYGNGKALKLLKDQFKIVDAEWRGFGLIKYSGLEPKDDKLNARLIYADMLAHIESKEHYNCRCGDVVRGLIKPNECKLFNVICTPEDPKGACMVSAEGACSIYYRYKK
jgi:hydrogenase expression/formation protein HypD